MRRTLRRRPPIYRIRLWGYDAAKKGIAVNESEVIVQGLQIAGVSVFLFVLFYYYMRKQFELFDRSTVDQRQRYEQTLEATTKTFERILDEQRIRDERNYELNKEFMETLQHHAGIISRMEGKIDHLQKRREL